MRRHIYASTMLSSVGATRTGRLLTVTAWIAAGNCREAA